jgi:hypothetical protein
VIVDTFRVRDRRIVTGVKTVVAEARPIQIDWIARAMNAYDRRQRSAPEVREALKRLALL